MFEVRSAKRNKLIVGIDRYAAEIQLAGNSEWQPVILTQGDFCSTAGVASLEWTGIRELRLGAMETLRSKNNSEEQKLTLGANWQGVKPDFRNLHWITE